MPPKFRWALRVTTLHRLKCTDASDMHRVGGETPVEGETITSQFIETVILDSCLVFWCC